MEWQRRCASIAAYAISFVMIRVLSWLDDRLHWAWRCTLTVSNVDSTLEVFIAGMLSFIVFTFASLLVAIQVTSTGCRPIGRSI